MYDLNNVMLTLFYVFPLISGKRSNRIDNTAKDVAKFPAKVPAKNTSMARSIGPVPSDCMWCMCVALSGCQIPVPVCHLHGYAVNCGPYRITEIYWKEARKRGSSIIVDGKCHDRKKIHWFH